MLAGTLFSFNGSLGASLPSGASSSIAQEFRLSDNDTRIVLLNSLYLLGFIVGPLLFGPLSECVGRRPVLIGTYLAFVLFTLGCALSPTFESLLVFRFFCGVNGSVPNALLGGLYSDIYDDAEQRGTAMSIFMFTGMAGPMAGPLVSGVIVLLTWRWVFWVALITAGACVPCILLLPETYLPVLIQRAQLKSSLNPSAGQPNRGQEFSARKIFIRPFVMLLTEAIVAFTSLYLAVIYAVLFLFFQAYPVVFQGTLNSNENLCFTITLS